MCNLIVYANILNMRVIEKWQNLSRKKKAYLSAFLAIIGIMLWAFISAGIITHNFNRSQLQTSSDRQEALIKGVILTETKNEKKYWEIYGETGKYDSNNGVAILNSVIGNFYDENDEVSMSFESSRGTYNSKKSEIILQKTDFFMADLSYALIDGVQGQEAILYHAILFDTKIKNSNFENANFSYTDLTNTKFML